MKTIKLMADYQCFPLWEASPGDVGNIDPISLPISISLRKSLMDWAQLYDATLNWEDPATSGFTNVDSATQFMERGEELAQRLREELGSKFVVLLKVNASVKTNRA